METVFQITAVCLLVAVLAALLKKNTPELALVLAATAAVVVLLVLVNTLGEIISFLQRLLDAGGLPQDLFVPLFKVSAIALVSRIAGELCRDAGENATAVLVDISGAIGAVVVSLPLFEAVWEILQSLI
ncbi:MAG: stage III sporulation AC/AD family protein [Oscillospiraceae bacterium]|nr:stage III sporulation AC/AD family protein [Oscillospiraceae bacterium]